MQENKPGSGRRFIAWFFPQDESRIAPLDGIRALMVLLVAWFHIWQQSWLAPVISIFGTQVSLDFLLRTGYIWVDGLLLLSGFLLYLPYAQAKESGRQLPQVLPFYKKRALRIIPSFYLSILVMLFFVAIPYSRYRSGTDMMRDLAAHATFTHTLFAFSYTGTPLNGALWTLGVEMQFYFLFPFLARLFVKKPVPVYLLMSGAALAYRAYAGTLPDTSMYFNQLPAFLDVYANGFVAASVYAALKKRLKEDGWTGILFTVCACVSVYALILIARGQAGASGWEGIRRGQMDRRFPLSAALSLLILGGSFGLGGVRMLLGNRITRFLSDISFQFYIWHQVFAVQLKEWGFPPSVSPTPNQAGEVSWQQWYTLSCFFGALLIASLVTYLFEKPIAARFGSKKKKTGRIPA